MIEGTAYPVLEDSFSPHILLHHYTPTEKELEWARQSKSIINRVGFLLQLKLFQKLGHFTIIADCPEPVVETVCQALELRKIPDKKRAAWL